MLTKEQALNANEFHLEGCKQFPSGPRGGKGRIVIVQVRRNGKTQTWKTRHEEWSLPVKYGLYSSGAFRIKHTDANQWHTASECPLVKEVQNAVAH